MTDLPPARCAADAVRYLYLAGVAQREGHEAAASRLRARAAAWIDANLPQSAAPGRLPDRPNPERRSEIP